MGALAELDRAGLLLARTRLHSPGLDRAVSVASRLGEHGACWIVIGCVGAARTGEDDRERRRAWLRGVAAVAGAHGLNYAIKLKVARRRPSLPGLPPLTPTVSELSFPSAHATTSFAAARVYSRERLLPAGPLYAVAIAFGLSRPYLGVHYPSDVIAGAVLGTFVGGLVSRKRLS